LGDDSKLRIALMGETGGPGGAERMMLQLAEELRRRGHEVFPIGPARRDPWLRTQFRERGFEPNTFDIRGQIDPLGLAQIVRLLRRLRVDVVHTHEFQMSVYGGLAAWLQGTPFVITMHGGRYYAERLRRRLALRWSVRRCRALVGVSAATAAELVARLGVPASAVQVVHNGVRYRAGDPSKLRAELGIAPEELLVVAVGNLYPVKGHAGLLDALSILDRGPDEAPWRLAIAGRGKEEDTLRRMIASRGWERRVHLLGYREDIADVIAAADVFAMPSLSEGLPLALVEAMFAAKPIVASRIGGVPEVVSDGVEALLTPPGDAATLAARLRHLLSSAELRSRLGRSARQRASERLSAERMTDAYERLYAGQRT
jgi:glycosyltransferase involved in cell wall biosynthesis